ncbi:MAG: DUF4347 domain-containing protein, partial [Verrucomicrobiota bacterium]
GAVTESSTLLDQISATNNSQIVVLDSSRDGIEQITEALSGENSVSAIHILSHGVSGNLLLGNTRLNSESLGRYAAQLSAWQTALSFEADILLYGCDVAAGASGSEFISGLAELTGADVAASIDATGDAALGGDWNLESTIGSVETAGLFDTGPPQFNDLLDDVVVSGSGSGEPAAGTDGNDTYRFQNGLRDVALDGKGGTDTLDFSAITSALQFWIRVAGGATEISVRVKDSGNSATVTAKNFENILGTNQDDVFVIESGGQLAGTIDAKQGTDTLSYSDVIEAFTSSMMTNLATGAATAIFGGAANGIISIESVIGGKGSDSLSASNNGNVLKGGEGADNLDGGTGNDTLEGEDGWDVLNGGGGIDTLKGGEGKDTLRGDAGNDKLHGGKGDDKYAFNNDWDSDELTEIEANVDEGGTDALDFSKVTVALKFTIGSATDGIMVDDIATPENKLRHLGQPDQGVKHIERLLGGSGLNLYSFEAGWNTDVAIENSPGASGDAAILDFSAVTQDLEFTISDAGKVTVLNVSTGKKVTATHIKDLRGGQGNNTYKFTGSGSIAGTLKAGADNQDASKINVLDYSGYGDPLHINLGDQLVPAAVSTVTTKTIGRTAILDVRSLWHSGAGGTFTLTLDGQTTAPIKWDAGGPDIENALKALRKDGQPIVKEVQVTGDNPWTITFKDPVHIEDGFGTNALTVNADGLLKPGGEVKINTQSSTTELSGTIYVHKIHTNALGGSFKLKYENDLTNAIAHDATAGFVEASLELLPGIDDASVTGTGTSADPWVVTILDQNAKEVVLGDQSGLLIKGGVATVLTTTVGRTAIKDVRTLTNNATGGTFTLTLDGQTTTALPYNATAAAIQTALESLRKNNNPVVENVTITGILPWEITFDSPAHFADPGGSNALTVNDSLLLPALPAKSATGIKGGATNGITGKIGKILAGNQKNIIVAPETVQLVGGTDSDTISGGISKDKINGGAGDDTLNGNGEEDTIDGGDGSDTISGGDANDKLNGQAGNDKLAGGEGDDRLTGGEGDDRLQGGGGFNELEGGPGNDTYVFEGTWKQDRITEVTGGGAEDVVDLSRLTSPYTHIFNEQTMLSVPGWMRQGAIYTGTEPAVITITPLTSVISNRVQKVHHDGTWGSFKLVYNGEATYSIPFNAPASFIEAQLETITGINNVSVKGDGTIESPWEISFISPLTSISLLTTQDNTMTRPGGNVSLYLERKIEDTHSYNPFTIASGGYVRVAILGFLPGQNAVGSKTEISGAATDEQKKAASAVLIAPNSIHPNGKSREAITEVAHSLAPNLFSDVKFILRYNLGDGDKDVLITLSNENDLKPNTTQQELVDDLNRALTAALPANVKITASNEGTLTYGIKFTLEHDGAAQETVDGKTYLKPASLTLLPATENAIVLGMNGSASVLPQIEKLILPGTDNTFVFGNNWGYEHILPSVIEPAVITAYKNWNRKLVIDTSKVVADGGRLILDFRAVRNEMKMAFEADDNGKIKLTVARVAKVPGVLSSLVGSIPGASDVIPQFVMNFLDGMMENDIEFAEIEFTDIGSNTVIYGGGNENTYVIDDDMQFGGKLIGGFGLRPFTASVLNPANIIEIMGLKPPTLTVLNHLEYTSSFNFKKVANTRIRSVTLDGFFFDSPSDVRGFLPGKVLNMEDIQVGAGLNLLLGTGFESGLDLDGTFDSSRMSLGTNKFTISG